MRRWTDGAKALVRPRNNLRRRHYSLQAQKQVQSTSPSTASTDAATTRNTTRRDPAALVAPELDALRQSLIGLLGSAHPGLDEIAKYYFLHPSKQMRPLLVLLFARATNGLGGAWRERRWAAECANASPEGTEELDRPLTRADVLNDWNPAMPSTTASFSTVFSLVPPTLPPPHPPVPALFLPSPSTGPALSPTPPWVLPTQRRLAQIVEMIHVASLLHDDVIDASALRRGVPSAPAAFGNKLAVLGGDFLLGRASAALARLGDSEVVELIATVIANLVEGEILQMRDVKGMQGGTGEWVGEVGVGGGKEAWNVYLKKTYLKTASLMAKGCRASVVLGGCQQGEVWKELAYAFGRNFGLAFQLVDDVLDYESGEATLGKPGGADLQLGLATGPALYAWEEFPEMGPLILRKFEGEGDVEMARALVRRSSGVARTRELAKAHADKARELLLGLPESEARAALEVLTERVVTRTW
ncbi:terpenoid synthase [Mycena sanguinolenta]|nr:terpenoid synthase [Mycena sanguinolenta]